MDSHQDIIHILYSNSNRIKTTATMSATTYPSNFTFYPRDHKMSITRDEYDGNFFRSVEHRVLCGVLDTLEHHYPIAYKHNELNHLYNKVRYDWGRPWILDGHTPPEWIPYWLDTLKVKEEWMKQTELICKEVRNKVSDKSWVKPKINPRHIEFPQDVFNVIKDYLGVYDIPEPVTELMGMMKLKNLITNDKDLSAFLGKRPNIKKQKDLNVDERVRLYNAYVIRGTKNLWNNGSEILDIANKYPQLRFGKELTDNNKIFLLRLLFNDYYKGVWRDGHYDIYSLFDILCGDIGISSSKIIHKKPKPYVMYLENDKNDKWWQCSNHYLNHVGFGCGDIRRSDVLALRHRFVYY
jgi:hypothetical protein